VPAPSVDNSLGMKLRMLLIMTAPGVRGSRRRGKEAWNRK
jgi:hypothetical protein